MAPTKMMILAALVAGTSAFAPAKTAFTRNIAVYQQEKPKTGDQATEMGWSMGGEAHTRDPTPQVNEDPRKTIPQGESFEEYMKARQAAGQ